MGKKNYKRGYWPKERCLEEAKKYTTRKDFGRGAPNAYKVACQQGWLDDICSHMVRLQQPRGYWTKERCLQTALKYSTRSEFSLGSNGAYKKAYREGWLDDICLHMTEPTKPNGYWTKDKCQEEAIKYQTRSAFKDGNNSAYQAAYRHRWLEEICAHMEQKIHKFTKEECHEEAKKYSRRIDFMNNSPYHYSWAIRHGFMKDICSHMEHQGNLHRRKIYVFEFADQHAYVGLAQYPKSRERQHLKEERSAVYKYIQKTGCSYVFKELTGFMDKEDAANAEDEWIKKYADDGWIMINKKPGGDLGYGPQKYTKEFCAEEAKKYQYRVDFKKNNSIIYNYASRHDWLEDICQHMTLITRKPHFWTKDKCIDEALKYKSKKQFQKESGGAYAAALDNGWLDKICSHMKRPTPSNYYWTKDRCKEEAIKYDTLKDFRINSYAYNAALKRGWLDEICSHMTRAVKPAGYWTKEKCISEAQECKTLSLFRKKNPSGYSIAWKKGWIEEIKTFLQSERKRNGYWTKERCAKEALKYRKRIEFQKNSITAFSIAFKNGWLDEICSHMSYNEYDPRKWTKERCFEEGSKYTTRGKFKMSNPSAYKAAREKGWLDEIFENKLYHGYRSERVYLSYCIINKKKL